MFRSKGFFVRLVFIALLFNAVNSKIISTTSGNISGSTISVLTKYVDSYIGIRYAEPPVGELRFKPPVPVKPWNGTYSATEDPPSCMQFPCVGNCSEDCLYLNMWVPSNATGKTSVMVWYHGGAFIGGSINGEGSNGSIIAALGNVIVVTVAYRLGPFGFLCSETVDARGNMGMKDQVLALRWVKDNIRYFGGDPSNVTLFGGSAGAISISTHLVSPLTKGLFKSAIMQSGSAYISYLAIRNSSLIKWRSTMLAVEVGCASEGEDISVNPAVMACMRSKNASSLVTADTIVMRKVLVGPENPWYAIFTPIYGDDYLPTIPIRNMSSCKIHAENLIIGNTKDEGSGFMVLFVAPNLKHIENPVINKSVATFYISQMFRGLEDIRARDVVKYYLANATFFDPSLLKRSYNSQGDVTFHCPSVLLANSSSACGKNVYFYNFTHRWSRSQNPKWMGSVHGEEGRFIFGLPFRNESAFLPEEKRFSGELIGCWTSFAKHGKPKCERYSDAWLSYTNHRRVAVNLNPYNVSLDDPFKDACYFWNMYNRY